MKVSLQQRWKRVSNLRIEPLPMPLHPPIYSRLFRPLNRLKRRLHPHSRYLHQQISQNLGVYVRSLGLLLVLSLMEHAHRHRI